MEAKLLELLDEAMAINGATHGKVRLVRDGALVIRAHRGLSSQFIERFKSVPLDSEIASARAYRSRQRVVVSDIQALPQDPYRAVAIEEGFRSLQSTPGLDQDGQVVLTLSTHNPDVRRPSGVAGTVLDFCARRMANLVDAAGS